MAQQYGDKSHLCGLENTPQSCKECVTYDWTCEKASLGCEPQPQFFQETPNVGALQCVLDSFTIYSAPSLQDPV